MSEKLETTKQENEGIRERKNGRYEERKRGGNIKGRTKGNKQASI